MQSSAIICFQKTKFKQYCKIRKQGSMLKTGWDAQGIERSSGAVGDD
jgi:hypothetical protein